MKKHFACDGDCGGVAASSGVCSADDCSMSGEELQVCECDSPEHTTMLENNKACADCNNKDCVC